MIGYIDSLEHKKMLAKKILKNLKDRKGTDCEMKLTVFEIGYLKKIAEE